MKKTLVIALALAFAFASCANPTLAAFGEGSESAKPALAQPESRAISLTAPDAWEQDDYQSNAKAIAVTGALQEHNFYDDAYDWYSFAGTAGKVYVIESFVSGYTDTTLTVYDGSTQKAYNDDKTSTNYGSRISFTAPLTKTYTIKCYSYGGAKGSNLGYTISVTGSGTTPPPPPPPSGTFTENTALPLAVRDYYRSAYGLSGTALKTALKNIVTSTHSIKTYTGLWTMFQSTDKAPNGKVWDMYSSTSSDGTSAAYWFTFVVDQDPGSGSTEGEYYNREHTWPNSTFGGTSNAAAYADGHSLTPTDKIVNSRRSNYAYGEVGTATWTSRNGSKLGSARTGLGYSGTVFEPISFYKGDHARMHFYQALRYYGDSKFLSCAWAASGAKLLPWYDTMLRSWAASDPVSAKEIARNNAVQAWQGNRNPFIDYPELIGLLSLTQ
ncbi:MAG: endonuclease [Spirochaetales bacterium]|nr:endonuclease [Spirochaetales bacterium]